MAREIGFEAPDFKTPCSSSAPAPGAEPIVCKAKILGQWVDTQTFR
jgi:UMF1 family MFS transporter